MPVLLNTYNLMLTERSKLCKNHNLKNRLAYRSNNKEIYIVNKTTEYHKNPLVHISAYVIAFK